MDVEKSEVRPAEPPPAQVPVTPGQGSVLDNARRRVAAAAERPPGDVVAAFSNYV
jgi:hypothetical protein